MFRPEKPMFLLEFCFLTIGTKSIELYMVSLKLASLLRNLVRSEPTLFQIRVNILVESGDPNE